MPTDSCMYHEGIFKSRTIEPMFINFAYLLLELCVYGALNLPKMF